MKILQIVGDSKYGGASFLIIRFAEAAMERGWAVDVLATDARFQEVLREHGIGVVDLDVIWRPIRPMKDYRGGRRLVHFLKQSDYDLVHTHTSKAGIVGRWAAHKAKIKAIMHTVHGFAFHEASGGATIKAYALLEQRAARWCHKVVTVSEFHRDWAIRLGIGDRGKVVAIPNGIPVPATSDPETIRRLRGELRTSDDEVLLLAAGRLAPQKGFEYLIEAMPKIRESLSRPVRLVMAGDGPLRDKLERQAHNLGIDRHVCFLGFRRDVADFFQAADVIVMPSLWEGLSIVLLEALALGRPVVTTTIGSNREVTRDGEGAILVDPRDARALADAVCRLASSEEERHKIAEQGHRLYREHYTEAGMLDAYMDLYDRLTRQPTGVA